MSQSQHVPRCGIASLFARNDKYAEEIRADNKPCCCVQHSSKTRNCTSLILRGKRTAHEEVVD